MEARIFVICLVFVKIVVAQEDPLVELPNGRILGRQVVTYANTTYFSFQKIPYAAPPVGPLRFKAPQPAQNWTGILDATVLDVSCYGLTYNIPTDSEDCLFVNVYTPKLPTGKDDGLLPVMFYIHGGAFYIGSSMLAPPDLYVDNGVVLVTINYRLGPFGFLSTEDEVIPGNNGLKDQRLGIQWAHDNVHLFGGDPNQITIFGLSAGSASVAYQLLNQASDGLFRAAIMESGSCLSPWTYQRQSRTMAFGTAAKAGFSSSNDSEALLQFLQSLDAEELDSAAEQYFIDQSAPWGYDGSQGIIYTPVIEVENPDAFLTRKMYGLIQAGNVIKVPTIIGITSEEGLSFFRNASLLQLMLTSWDQNPDQMVPYDMQITDSDEHMQMALKIRDIYTGGEPWGTRLGDGIRCYSDNSFARPVTKHAELYSSLAETYFYQFSYDGEAGGLTIHYDGAENVGHGEENNYLFCTGEGCSFENFPEGDLLTSKRMIKLWTDFAKYMNPTPEPVELLQNVTWPRLSVETGDFLYLDINENLEVRNRPKEAVLIGWNELYGSLNFTDFDTY